LPVFSSLDYIIVTEHQLSAEFLPDEIIKSGWDFKPYPVVSQLSPNEDIEDSGTEVD